MKMVAGGVGALLSPEARAPFDARLACLDERRLQLAGLVGVLERADETVVENSGAAVLNLEAIETCLDDRRAGGGPPRPGEPLHAQISYTTGLLDAHAGDHESAIEKFERSVEIGIEFGMDEMVAHAAMSLAMETPIHRSDIAQEIHRQQGDLESAWAIDDQIVPLIQSAYGPNHNVVGVAFARRGTLLGVEGRHEEAVEYLSRALRIMERNMGVDDPRLMGLLGNRGIILTRMGRHDEAVAARAIYLDEGARGAGDVEAIDAWLVESGE